MQLAKDIMRAMRIKRGEWWRAKGLPLKIARGQATLKTLGFLANVSRNCSLTFLLSGGRYEERTKIPLVDAVEHSIMHAGKDKHDVAREIGYRDFNYPRRLIMTQTMQLRVFLKLCKAINMLPWQVVCDSNYVVAEDPNAEPTYWEKMLELNQMGWLDAPINKEARR